MKAIKSIFFTAFALGFLTLIIYSGFQIWKIDSMYQNEDKIREKFLQYKPGEAPPPAPEQKIVNQSIIDLQNRNSDVAGWLEIPGTAVDYPFVWYENNDFYLHRNLDGEEAAAGTIFMDYRCERDFSSQNTILYGHHMKNKSMFGSLESFGDPLFFEKNKTAVIYLPNDTLELQIFAYLVINPDNEKELYSINLSENYVEYVQTKARRYVEIALNPNDRIVTLSSCAYEFKGARMVLLAKIQTPME